MSYPQTCPGCQRTFQTPGALMNHGRYAKDCSPEKRFWGRVKKTDGCWLWQGAVNTTGYGMVSWAGTKNNVAHRVALRLLGIQVPEGMLCLHKCDTPRCVNPDHIFFGTDADNHRDKMQKGRQTWGESTKRNKLTAEQVLEIRRLYKRTGHNRSNSSELAAKYGVTNDTIRQAAVGKTWGKL